jgi:hypothetical protein
MTTKVSLTGGGIAALSAVAAVVTIGVFLYTQREAIAGALNPLSNKNIVNRAANAIVDGATGGDAQTVSDLFQHGDGTFKWPWEDYIPLAGTAERKLYDQSHSGE